MPKITLKWRTISAFGFKWGISANADLYEWKHCRTI